MAIEHHVTRLAEYAIIRISGYIVKELEKGSISVFVGRSLLL